MKANTIEQYKILQDIKQNFHEEFINIEIIDRAEVKVIDALGNSMIFYYDYESGEVKYK